MTRARMYARYVAMASSAKVTSAEDHSLRARWKMVAQIITSMIPTAAQVTSQGRIRARPGRMSPTAARTSATPRNLEPARHRRVHLRGDIRRRNQEQQPMGEERRREENLQNPEHDVHHCLRLAQ
jgi:hypothetical protein